MFNIMLFLLVVYLLLSRYLEIKILMQIEKNTKQNEEKTEKAKRTHAKVAKIAYTSPLKTFKE